MRFQIISRHEKITITVRLQEDVEPVQPMHGSQDRLFRPELLKAEFVREVKFVGEGAAWEPVFWMVRGPILRKDGTPTKTEGRREGVSRWTDPFLPWVSEVVREFTPEAGS